MKFPLSISSTKEGIRAKMIDKDHQPRYRDVEDISEERQSFFESLPKTLTSNNHL